MAEPNLGELIASTDEKRETKTTDLVENANVLYHLMKQEGNVTEDFEGRQLYIPVAYADNDSYQAIDPTEELNLAFNRTLDVFTYSPKQSVVSVMISEVEKAQNRGPLGVLPLLKERSRIAESTMVNEVCTDLNGDGSGRGGKAFAGIKSYIADTVSSGSVGGISRSSYTVIRNISTNLPSTYTGATSAANIEDRVLALKNQIFVQGDKFIGYMGSSFYRMAAEALRSRQVLQDPDLKSAGFGDHIVLEGIPFFLAGGFNPQGGSVIASDRFYLISPKAFKFSTYKGYNMQALPNRVSTKQLVDVALRLLIGQFVCMDPARNALGYDS
jgi:hypothetical protein